MWVRTRTGVSHIELRPMTLAAKAVLFEKRVRERHDRHGLVAPSILLDRRRRDDESDRATTIMTACGPPCTPPPNVSAMRRRNRRRRSPTPGRPPRPYCSWKRSPGSEVSPPVLISAKASGCRKTASGIGAEDRQYYWKGDTSSDEIVGHLFLYSVATDLLPDAALKQRIAGDHRPDLGSYSRPWLLPDRRDLQADDVGPLVAGLLSREPAGQPA